MALPDEHFDQARDNRDLASRLLASYPAERAALQWAVTMAFYAALHCMTGHLLRVGVRVSNHQHREAALADPRNRVPPDVYDAYLRLKRRSVGARYDLWTFTEPQVRDQVLGRYLTRIAAFVGL